MTNRVAEPFRTASHAITVRAPAKVNLVLRVLDRRDDGFHNLWSLMQTVGLEDEIVLRLNGNHADIRLECDDPSLSTGDTNLVWRAAEAVRRQSGQNVGVDIALTKRIPMGAGLGGGSSDAAATIAGLNRLLNLGRSGSDMARIGQVLGSDVPFFFYAPTAVVTGRGEQVHPVRIDGKRWVVLVNPGFSVETKWAYQELSSRRAQVCSISDRHISLGQAPHISWDPVLQAAENDFEAPVFEAYPSLREMKRGLLEQGAETALLSGSGATVFGIFSDEMKARQAGAQFEGRSQFKVFVVPTASGPLLVAP